MNKDISGSLLVQSLLALALLIVLFLAGRPYVTVVADTDFGFAVSARTSEEQKFAPLFVYRFER